MWAQMLEDVILGKLIAELIAHGYRIEICDQDGGGLFVYAAADGGEKPAGGYEFWVRLTPGNAEGLITDYSTNLERVVAPVNKFAMQFGA